MFRMLKLLPCILLICASCSNESVHTVDEWVNRLSLLPPSPICIDSSQIIYYDLLPVEVVDQEQLQLLSNYVCESKPNDVWFIRVLHNKEGDCWTHIYFLPDESTERIRKGKMTFYNSSPLFSSIVVPKEDAASYRFEELKQKLRPEYHDYIQVLPPYANASCPPGISRRDSLLPFPKPEGFSDQEVIEILDFLRSEMEKEKLAYGMPLELLLVEEPIMSIHRENDIIVIRTGTQSDFLAGTGRTFHLRKTEDDYEIVGETCWIS